MNSTLYTFMSIFETPFEYGKKKEKLKRIEIPIIQRDYAQGRTSKDVERVRARFLDTLYKAVNGEPITLDFVYGDITDGVLTPLDGQQRLTTLFLLYWYAAKKDQVPDTECGFLEKFSYETRYSARDFCHDLVKFTPAFTEKQISSEIKDQYWYPLEWGNDPTIRAMLVMLDAIEDRFKNVDGLWQKLKEGKISFYFLAIEDMGLTDELYIKMNSRGKPLTQFEHFKAEFEQIVSKVLEPEKADAIALKIDTVWTDMLWEYRNSGAGSKEDDVIDDEFLRYFRFVCDVICYKEGKSTRGRSDDEFDWLNEYFVANDEDNSNDRVVKNIQLLEDCFDCWCGLPEGSPQLLQNRFLSINHEPGKVMTNSNDVLESWMHSKQTSLPNLIRLYAFVVFLLNRKNFTQNDSTGNGITNELFCRRLRVINNLVKNSQNEMSDSEDRRGGNRMPNILRQVESIIVDGIIIEDEKFNNFNVNQITEEKEKLIWTEMYPDQAETLFALEDHELLDGQISILGIDHIDYAARFASLFSCDRKLVDRVMMTIGFYGQSSKSYKWRYQLGSANNNDGWRELFHKGANDGFEKTSKVLIELLAKSETFTNEMLQSMINSFLSACETESRFPWEYYYVKYDAFRPYTYGKYATNRYNIGSYMYYVMLTRSYWSPSTFLPILKEADAAHIRRDPDALILHYNNATINGRNDSFIIKWNDKDPETIHIPQEDGIDTEDRIILLKSIIAEYQLN